MSTATQPKRRAARRQVPAGARLASCLLAVFLCLLALPSAAWAVDVLFVGDSLTAGYYATSEGQSFRALTSAWFALHGHPTSTTLAAFGGKIAGAAGETAEISAAGADVAVIEVGTNDASGYPTWRPTPAQEFESDYRSVLQAVRSARPEAHLVLLGVWKEKADRSIYDGIIARLATEYGGCFVNLESLSDEASLSGPAGRATYNGTSDTFHPNDAGHQAIAAAVEQAFSWQGGITLDDGAPATNDPTVTVSATPGDQFADITHMRLTSDLSAWPDWQSFTSSSNVMLPDGDGQYTVYAQFKNQLGSLLPVVAGTIILDTVAPKTTSTADDLWHAAPVRLTLSASDASSGVDRTLYKIDGGSWQTGTTVLIPAPASHSDDGRHKVSYYSVDNAGNREAIKTCTVKIDTRGPRTIAPRPCTVVRGFWPALSYRAQDALSPKADITIRIRDHSGRTRKLLHLGWQKTGKTHVTGSSVWRCRLPRGTYRYTVLARDLAGNSQTRAGSNRLIVL